MGVALKNSRLLEDAEARKMARTTFDGPIVLRAGAGTGKTAALVARIVAWSIGPGWAKAQDQLKRSVDVERIARRTLSRIVAITFTEAAAAEMAERIAEAFHAIGNGSTVIGLPLHELNSDAQSRAEALLAAIDMLQVRTIHAWCRSILSQYPIESGVHPKFRVDADGTETADIIRDCVETGLSRILASADSQPFFELLRRGVGPQQIEAAVSTLVAEGWTEPDADNDPFSHEVFRDWRLQLTESCAAIVACLGESLTGVRAPNATKLLSALEAVQSAAHNCSDFEQLAAETARALPENLRRHLVKAWVKGRCGKAENEALAESRPRLSQLSNSLSLMLDELDGLDVVGYLATSKLVGPIVEQVHAQRNEKGILVFGDLLRLTNGLLQRPGVAGRVRESMDQLLVDEFQDTDALQCGIVRSVAMQGDKRKRPGLFIVGDPKQSIYGWRNADLHAYETFVGELLKQGAHEFRLIQNFRSVGAILEEVDRTMEGLMIADPGFQPIYESLVPSREEGAATDTVEHWVTCRWDDDVPNQKTGSVEARQIEAAELARDVVRLHNEGVAYSSIGVLFRSMTSVDVYQQALRDAGVPYEVTRDQQYYRRSEVIEAASMVRSILDPLDMVALVTFLRSAMIQVPDAALVALWAESFPEHWVELGRGHTDLDACHSCVQRAGDYVKKLERTIDGLERVGSWVSHLQWVMSRTHALRQNLEFCAFDQWLHEVRKTFRPDLICSMAYQGVYRLANLEQFFRNIECHVEDKNGDWSVLLRHLREAVAEQLAAEEARPSETVDAVQMLTIHKSKGLAFSHTYLADMHHRIRAGERSKGTLVTPDAAAQIAGFWPPGIRTVWEKSERVSAAERIRLLYVAMTRARDRLVFMGMWPKEPGDSERPRTAVDLLSRREPSLPSPWDIAAHADHEGRVEWDGMLWRFPGRMPIAHHANSSVEAENALVMIPIPELRMTRLGAAPERAWTQGPSAAKKSPAKQHSPVSRSDALLAGVAVHSFIEKVAAQRSGPDQGIDQWVETALSRAANGGTVPDAARGRATELAETFMDGTLFRHLLAVDVLGLEVPMLLEGGPDGPVAGWVGNIDLLYTDPDTGRVVVADYKTDRVKGKDSTDVSHRHAPQGAVYVEAVKRALALDYRPDFEVWLIETDERIKIETV